MSSISCPECEYQIEWSFQPSIGQQDVCPTCKSELEVVSLDPLEADLYSPKAKKPAAKKGRTEAVCPECDQRLKLSANPRVGQVINCSRCKTKLAIVSTSPLEIDVFAARRKRKDKKGPKWKRPLYQ